MTTRPGDILTDDFGARRVVVTVQSGRMPMPIDTSSPFRGSSAERCAIYGGKTIETRSMPLTAAPSVLRKSPL